MAEAAVEQRPLNTFFCHQCSVEISPNLPDYTCPRCQSGFIEEITAMEETQPPPQNDPAAQFAELFGRSFLQSFQHHIDTDSQLDDTDSEADDADVDNATNPPRTDVLNRHSQIPTFGMTAMPGARISIRTRQGNQDGGTAAGQGDHRNHALQSILQTLLSGLMGGPAVGGNQGGPGMGAQFPFGNMFSMYGSPGDYAWGTGGLDNIITQLLNQMEGTGPPPANKEDIDSLKEVHITNTETDRGIQCSVCMEDFKEGETAKGLPCEHLFHPDCILPWLELHGTCPVCRKSVSSTDSPSSPNNAGTRHSNHSSSRSRNSNLYQDEYD